MNVPYVKQVIRWVIFAIILYLLGRYIIDHRHDFSFLSTLRWTSLIPIVLLTLVSFLLEAFRYFLVIREMETSVPFVDVFRHLMVARFLNRLVPQSGIAYRAHAFKNENESRIIPARWGSEFEVKSNINNYKKIISKIIRQIGFTFELARKPRLLLSGGLIIMANTAISVWSKFFLFQLIGVTAKISELALFVGLNKVSNILVVTPGNLGITESLYGVLSGMLGIGAAQGVVAALTLRTVIFLILACLSALLLFLKSQKAPGGPPAPNQLEQKDQR